MFAPPFPMFLGMPFSLPADLQNRTVHDKVPTFLPPPAYTINEVRIIRSDANKEIEMKLFTKKEEQILLAIYHLKEKAYLISIREEIKKYTGKTYSVGTIYAPLNRLHGYGYLSAQVQRSHRPSSGKPIKYYRLTKNGYSALAALNKQNRLMWEGFELPVLED
jgi:DNA-binding PadR family transcriptional regulator